MRVAQNNIPLLDRGASLAGGIIKFWDRGWEDSLKGIPVTSRLQEMPSPPHSKLCPWASWNCWHHTQEPQACRWCPKWEHSPLPPNVLTSWCWRVVGGTNMLLSLSDPWTWRFLRRRVSTDSDTKAVKSVLVRGTYLILSEGAREMTGHLGECVATIKICLLTACGLGRWRNQERACPTSMRIWVCSSKLRVIF